MSRPTAKISPKSLKEDDQDSVKKAVDWPFRKPYWQSERSCELIDASLFSY